MAKDETGRLIHPPGHGPRCHIDRAKLDAAFKAAIESIPSGGSNEIIAHANALARLTIDIVHRAITHSLS